MNVYSVPHEKTSPLFARAFAEGCGGTVRERYAGGAWSGFGSPENWDELQAAIKNGNDFFYGDHAYFGRHKFYRVTKNHYFHYGQGQSDLKRFQSYGIKVKNWQQGDKIILCPQSDGFFKMRGTTQDAWIKSCLDVLLHHTDRPIVIHHKRDKKPLADLLNNAWSVVTYSSNSALESLLHGVPAFCTGDSHARDMTLSNLREIEKPLLPDNRLEWAGVLADNQFTLAEMASGKAWEHLNGSW